MCARSAAATRVVSRCLCRCVLTIRGWVCLCSESTLHALEEALKEAEKYESRSEALAALLVVGRDLLEQARAEQAERARAAAAAEAAAAAAAAEAAAERLRMEEQAAALALQLQQLHAQLGVVAPVQQPEAEEALCVVCMDAPKQYAMVPCMHMCTCEACTPQLLEQGAQSCPVCRGPIESTTRVFT